MKWIAMLALALAVSGCDDDGGSSATDTGSADVGPVDDDGSTPNPDTGDPTPDGPNPDAATDGPPADASSDMAVAPDGVVDSDMAGVDGALDPDGAPDTDGAPDPDGALYPDGAGDRDGLPEPDMADPGCDIDDDCAGNEFCADDGACISGCRLAPDNCPARRRCNAVRQCVNGCADNAQCVAENGAGWVCEGHRCIGPCVEHADCSSGEVCAAGRCEAGCAADDFAGNDARADAHRVELEGLAYDSADAYLSICEFETDWFVFAQPANGAVLTVTVEFAHDEGDLDIRLHPPAGNALNAGSGNDDERIRVEDAANGDWHLEVFARGFDENRYRVRVEVELPAGACLLDEADPGDDLAPDAMLLNLPQLQSRQEVLERRICGGDLDWYAFDLGDGDGVDIEIAMTGMDGGAFDGLDFEVYGPGVPADGAFPTMLPDSFDEGPPVTIGFTAPRNNLLIVEGRYYLKVLGLAPDLPGVYDLAVEVDRVALACRDDGAEPNEARGDADDLMRRGSFTREALDGVTELRPDANLDLRRLSLCEGDEDWFRFELREGDDIDVRISRAAPVRGVVRVEITDEAGDEVGQAGQNGQAINVARLEDAAAGTYYGHVVATDADTTTNYDLRLNRTAGFIPCVDDRFEPNEARGDATDVDPGRYQDLSICGGEGDIDYFVVELDAVSDLVVDLSFDHDDANIDVDIFRDDNEDAENGAEQQGHGNGDGEHVVLGNRLPGLYTIAVRAVDGGTAAYELNVQINERVFVCQDDNDEANDSIDDATPLGGGTLVRDTQWLCDRVPAESDYFEISVPPNTERTIVTTFVFGDDGDLFLELYNDQRVLRATTNLVARVNSKQCIRIRSGGGDDTFYLRVAALNINRIIDDDERLDYTIHIANGDVCDDIGPPSPGVNWPRVGR